MKKIQPVGSKRMDGSLSISIAETKDHVLLFRRSNKNSTLVPYVKSDPVLRRAKWSDVPDEWQKAQIALKLDPNKGAWIGVLGLLLEST